MTKAKRPTAAQPIQPIIAKWDVRTKLSLTQNMQKNHIPSYFRVNLTQIYAGEGKSKRTSHSFFATKCTGDHTLCSRSSFACSEKGDQQLTQRGDDGFLSVYCAFHKSREIFFAPVLRCSLSRPPPNHPHSRTTPITSS